MTDDLVLVSALMKLTNLSGTEGAVFKYDDDGIQPIAIPREAWENYGRPTVVRVRISIDVDAAVGEDT